MFHRFLLLAFSVFLTAPATQAIEPVKSPTVKVAVYDDAGGTGKAFDALLVALAEKPEIDVVRVKASDIRKGKLTGCQVLIVPGGFSNTQGSTLGDDGRDVVRDFVKGGGGYVGFCAGAYLASCDYTWSLNILNAKVIDKENWARGFGPLDINVNKKGSKILGKTAGKLSIYYHQGPILAPAENPELPAYESLAKFEGEMTKKGAKEGLMIGTTAIAASKFGKGRVLCFSPHPEMTDGLHDMVHKGIEYVTQIAGAPAATAAKPMAIHLDATDAPRNRLRAKISIPASPGPLTLYYPRWIPGEHGPTGPVADLTGLKFRAGETTIPWTRDDDDNYAIKIVVPEGATGIDAETEFLTAPATKTGFSKGACCTPRLAILSWHHVLLYPKGKPIQEQTICPTVTLPEGWSPGCAMDVEKRAGARIDFAPVTLETLCDSPVLGGKHYKEIPIGPKDGPRHWLCLAADDAASLDLTPETIASFDKLVAEAGAVFGTRHYKQYRFLIALSDHIAHFGMEHHESSDNRGPAGMLTDPLYRDTWHAWLLTHEYTHSWNGKYRRPAAMVVPDFQKPIRSRLLWVYEGLTHYYGFVFASRCGLWKPERAREYFARIADRAVNQTGRVWRPLEDTSAAATLLYGSREDGWYRRRGVDFYDEGALVWLDADMLIREGTKGAMSLDDFCKRFHGGKGGAASVNGYELGDLIKALNETYSHDWTRFFADRVTKAGAEPPVGGINRSGWTLDYAAKRTDHIVGVETDTKSIELTGSLGLVVKDDGTVLDVVPGKPADDVGVAPGMKLLAVNGKRWTETLLRDTVAGTTGKGTVTLMTEQSGFVQGFKVNFVGGEKYPTLTRRKDTTDMLGAVLAPHVKEPPRAEKTR